MGPFSAAGLEALIGCTRRPAPAAEWVPGQPSGLPGAGLLSRAYFVWASPLVFRAADLSAAVTLPDLPQPPPEQAAATAEAVLEAAWAAETAAAAAAARPASFARALWRTVRLDFARVFAFKMGWLVFSMLSNSILLQELVDFLQPGSARPDWWGYVLALLFLLVECARSVSVNTHWMLAVSAGVRLRAGARALLFAKALRLRGGGAETGSVTTLVNNDAARLLEAASYGEFIFSAPVTLLVTLGVLWSVMGPSALAGFGVLLFFAPLQARLGRAVGRLRARTIRVTDERSKLMAEVLGGIKLLKISAWEASFAARVAEVRAREVRLLTTAALVRTLNTVVAFSVPVLVTLATFAAYVFWTGRPLDAGAAYVAVSLFNVARFPLSILPLATKNVSEALVAARRIAAFLALPEVSPDDLPREAPCRPGEGAAAAAEGRGAGAEGGAATRPPPAADGCDEQRVRAELAAACGDDALLAPGVLLEARAATFAWPPQPPAGPSEAPRGGGGAGRTARGGPPAAAAAAAGAAAGGSSSPPPTSPGGAAPAAQPAKDAITRVSFSLRAGETLAVVGPVASGKSSLVCALLGQLTRTRGVFVLARGARLAYAGQSPWVFSGSLRDNVLFGLPLDAAWYAAVLDACCLRPDLAQLPLGDATEIGERGLNLSGGQKARVALARAVYARPQLLLADDPLSAVDVHVGKALFARVLGPGGLVAAAGGAVLLVTHQTQYLPAVSGVLVLAPGGSVAHAGTYAQLTAAGVDLLQQGGGAGAAAGGDGASAEAGGGAATAAAALLCVRSTPPPTPSPSEATPGFAAGGGGPLPASTAVPVPPPGTAPALDILPGGGAGAPPPVVAAAAAATTTTAAAAARAGKLVVAEDRAVGSLAGSTVAAYLRAAGGVSVGGVLLAILVAGKGSRQVSDWWLSYWTQHHQHAGAAPEAWFLGLYAVTVCGVLLLTALQGGAFAVTTLSASRRLHDATLTAVFRAAPTFFDTQPSGRILARFTGDLDSVDTALPASTEQASEYLVQCLLAIVLIAAVFPYFLVALPAIGGMFWVVQAIFRRAARELKRVDSLSRSPLVSHVAATLGGLVTIRCSEGAVARYAATARAIVDDSTRAYFSLYISNRWIAIRLDFATAVVAFTAAILCAVNRRSLPPGLAGLVLTNALQLAGILQFATRLTTECEAQLTSVERLNHYADAAAVPREHLAVVPVAAAAAAGAAAKLASDGSGGGEPATALALRGVDDPRSVNALLPDDVLDALPLLAAPPPRLKLAAGQAPPLPLATTRAPPGRVFFPGWYPASWHPRLLAAQWPAHGAVEFRNVSVRYRPGLPLVLRHVSFAVAPGSRVGIVGRTGSGKSTTLLALLRYLETEPAAEPEPAAAAAGGGGGGGGGGCITLDGVDVARVNVYHLRSGVSVIPQDPQLYGGSLRGNVDPLGVATDAAIAAALEDAGAGALARGHPDGLRRTLAPGGGNLSVGERQLVCLARALLRRARVVCLDEATASTDAATDAAIQHTLRTSPGLAGVTLLTIAHRLHTVCDYDCILLLEGGRVVEYDSPAALLGLAPSLGGPTHTGRTGHFQAMVNEMGAEAAAAFAARAQRNNSSPAVAAAAAV